MYCEASFLLPNLYLTVLAGSGCYFNGNFRFTQLFIFSVDNINLLPTEIFNHVKTNLIKHMALLIPLEFNLFLYPVIYC